MDEIIFDPILGELRSETTSVAEKTERIVEVRGGGNTGAFVGADAPSNPIQGGLWLDTDTNTLYVYANGSWVAISGGVTVDGVYLTEAGDYITTEAGDYLAWD